MINRRGFLQVSGGAAGALLASGITCARPASARETGLDFDRAAAARELAAHRIVKITARQVRDRFPRSIGPNSRGRPVGGGGSYRVRTVTTDKGAEGWAMCYLPE